MNNNEFKYAVCNEVFEKLWTDEETIEEYKKKFSRNFVEEETNLVCDDCYKKMMGEYPIEDFLEDRALLN